MNESGFHEDLNDSKLERQTKKEVWANLDNICVGALTKSAISYKTRNEEDVPNIYALLGMSDPKAKI